MTEIEKEQIEHVRQVKIAHEAELLQKPNVVGVGIGLRQKRRQLTHELAIIVSVTRKVPRRQLDPEDVIPRELDGVPLDVQAVGQLQAH